MTELNSVYLAWQSPENRDWYVVGFLQESEDGYIFNYTNGAKLSEKFIPFSGMEQLDKTYVSDDLFPLFRNRLLSPRRPEYPNFIKWLGLESSSTSPIEVLARSGGLRGTDQLQMFKRVHLKKDNSFEHYFFVHGLSHLSESAIERVSKLEPGDKLYLCLDCQNTYDDSAVLIRAEKPSEIIGYCPRYLAKDINKFLTTDKKNIHIEVEMVSNDAPSNYRLMCKLSGIINKDHGLSPLMSEDEYQLISN
ncbi:HIRAN domain-containing protein [Aliivibrio sifiae]|uniref:Restriction endonuclease n=1 Tax=Aliivibrio sifiae TaxID=566293 RepID=A0A2S7X3J5_9GAMM|nr:HIRAN domain-containing protein [Aliivibrio sifiae]PQJ84608.1 restriction endonuclease [Aliivibrio sifiae]